MAALAGGLSGHLREIGQSCNRMFLRHWITCFTSARHNSFFRNLALEKEHNDNPCQYETTKDPKDWHYVERLMPLITVPEPKPKDNYPSGWRPMREEALNLSYFVERSRNHMLPVYLKIYERGQRKITKLIRIHGDLWKLHDELKTYVEEQTGRKIPTTVLEGNGSVLFKGDFVYYVEQWLLSKGF